MEGCKRDGGKQRELDWRLVAAVSEKTARPRVRGRALPQHHIGGALLLVEPHVAGTKQRGNVGNTTGLRHGAMQYAHDQSRDIEGVGRGDTAIVALSFGAHLHEHMLALILDREALVVFGAVIGELSSRHHAEEHGGNSRQFLHGELDRDLVVPVVLLVNDTRPSSRWMRARK